jgi:hypothetical protein
MMLWRMETRALRDRYDHLRHTSHRRDPRTGRLRRLGE